MGWVPRMVCPSNSDRLPRTRSGSLAGMKTAKNSLTESVRRVATWRRDKHFDGAFVFAVRTTGIYCRPSCPARRPRPDRILFFDAPEAAEQSGFRPCRRCHPREVGRPDAATERVVWLCREIDREIAEGPERPITLGQLGRKSGMSVHAVERMFRRHLGVTPRQYADARRVAELKTLLRQGATVTQALYDAGYGSSSRLYESAPAHLGMTPLAYRRGGKDVEIRYATVKCPLGRLQVAATGRGIAAIHLGDSEERLRRELKREFPQSRIREDRKGLARLASVIVDHLRDPAPMPDLPLDLRATAFQRRVWEELRRIPFGATRSYAEIARAIGNPKAARAVARACATNRAAIVIPCHRVVGKNGALAGYRWGIGRKRALLEMEASAIQDRPGPTPAVRRARKSRNHQSAQPETAQLATITEKTLAEIR